MSEGKVWWFGASWHAPICEEETMRPTPVGVPCAHCKEPIKRTDQGLLIMHLGQEVVRYPWHIACFERSLGGDDRRNRGLASKVRREPTQHFTEEEVQIGLKALRDTP